MHMYTGIYLIIPDGYNEKITDNGSYLYLLIVRIS